MLHAIFQLKTGFNQNKIIQTNITLSKANWDNAEAQT